MKNHGLHTKGNNGQRSGKASTLLLFFACGVMMVFSPAAFAQQEVNDRLNRMENDIQTLSRALYKGEPYKGLPSGGGAAMDAPTQAKMELRLSQLEIEIRSLTGKIEQQSFEIRQVTGNVERMLADLEVRVSELETKAVKTGAATQQGSPDNKAAAPYNDTRSNIAGNIPVMNNDQPVNGTAPLSSADRMVTPVTGNVQAPAGQLGTLVQTQDDQGNMQYKKPDAETPSELYEQAFTLLRDKNYEQAAIHFEAFLERYPGHVLASNAKYWLGETYYVRNDYERAARVFAEAYQQYPDGAKGPDNLLKLGMSLAGMGKTQDACLSFAQIKRQYSSGAGPILARADQEMKALNCP